MELILYSLHSKQERNQIKWRRTTLMGCTCDELVAIREKSGCPLLLIIRGDE